MAGHAIKIIARLRPRIKGEVDDRGIQVCHEQPTAGSSSSSQYGRSYISVPNPRDPAQVFTFPFSSCYGEDSTQEEIFERDVRPVIDVVYSGVTVTIFAYGVTSSGKTHTMQGTTAEPGVIPRVIHAIFEKQKAEHPSAKLSVSYMEIYKDEVYDLLVSREKSTKLPVRENAEGQIFVPYLSSEEISSYNDFATIYQRATKQRSVGSTNLNNASSRSHAILTVEVSILNAENNTTLTGKINLVDLAGSENNKMTGNDRSRMAESKAINQSLSVLGQVVHALNRGDDRIPYRNAKLTRILQDALGGNAVGLLICNLAPGVKFRQDTLNTLNFAVRTKNIENKPVINEKDNRPQPKAHFAAIQAPPPQLAAAVIPTAHFDETAPSIDLRTIQPAVHKDRPRPSRVPRPSAFGLGGSLGRAGGLGLPSFPMPVKLENEADLNRLSVGLTVEQLQEKINEAVAVEVARRMQEWEKSEEERRVKEREQQQDRYENSSSSSSSHENLETPAENKSIPTGILTPLLKRQYPTGQDIQHGLEDLEYRLGNEGYDEELADIFSPRSRKKTGRAYVALARAYSDKGELAKSLELYKKAETCVPDNIKLKDRIIEIEYAVRNGQDFLSSPKKNKKFKEKQGKRMVSELQSQPILEEESVDLHRLNELTNSPKRVKRTLLDENLDDVPDGQTPKRCKVNAGEPDSGASDEFVFSGLAEAHN